MKSWRQLRWRLIGAQMLVVIVGVTVLTISVEALGLRAVRQQILATMGALPTLVSPQLIAQTAATLTASMQQAVWQSLAVAAVAATAAGLVTSILLMREILRPLEEIAAGSRRIADGHYDERVAVPGSNELASVAHNFNQMADALAQVEAQRIQLIGNVAHELRTPLTGLRGYLEGLMDGLFSSEGEAFAHMYQEVRRLQRLVDDLQDLSRVEAGQIHLQVQAFDLISLTERIVGQVLPQANAESLNLYTDFRTDQLQVYADPDRTVQVLVNLLSNAIRYTPEGGQIKVVVDHHDQFALVSVIDTGVGISNEDLKQIFERFFRVDPSRTRRSGGSGIGLTIAQHLTWAMGGELSAASDGPGHGSTFRFTLPLA
jgi:histidine kinase